jgi:hypothetical protein
LESDFPELVLKEYTAIKKRATPTKDVSYRIRVLKRKDHEGLFKLFFEIREFITTERKALFTESGIYVNKEQLVLLNITLLEALRKYPKEFGTNFPVPLGLITHGLLI